jgi:extracellular elastinolytic metalloproteinase
VDAKLSRSYPHRPGQRRSLVAAGLAAATLLVLPATAPAVGRQARAPHPAAGAAKPYFDSRTSVRRAARRSGAPVNGDSAAQRSAVRGLRDRLGAQAAITIDPLTSTARSVQRLDGTLTAPASGNRADVAMRWIRANRTALGLGPAAVGALRLAARHLTAGTGVTELRYTQTIGGIPTFDNGLRVGLDRGGRIVSVTGSPLADLSLNTATPGLDAVAARRALQRNVGVTRPIAVRSRATGPRRTTTFADGDFARLVVFGAASGPRLAWHLTYRATSVAYYDAVVDASTGAVLYRQNLTKFATPVSVWPNYPGAERDTSPPDGYGKSVQDAKTTVDLEAKGWLAAGAPELSGRYVHTYSDVNDDNTVQAGERIVRRTPQNDFNWPFTQFAAPPFDNGGDPSIDGYTNACDYSGTNDPNAPPGWPTPLGLKADCAWNPTVRTSWQTNRNQNGVQAFYLANVFRDHLASPSIGFDGFAGADPLLQETDDGAASDTATGGPNGDHVNNANMSTLPDGMSPRMQMYVFQTEPDLTYTFRNINGGDDAGTVWHEYTHGLSNRLVTNNDGTGALSTAHAGAMGEAWSDWYALDLLHRTDSGVAGGALEFDNPVLRGDVDIGTSSDAIFTATRFEPIDCRPEDTAAARCPGATTTGHGGYTLGDFGHVADGPEVHSDGEIWMQTLWELRASLIAAAGGNMNAGSDLAEKLVTQAMRLSPPEPSFLDERNAIIAADQSITGGANRTRLWQVFAHRGMGYFASVTDSSDVHPVENMDMPPASPAAKGTIAGTVRTDNGRPLQGVPVGIAGLSTDPKFPDFLGATTNAAGRYSFAAPAHTYKGVVFTAQGGYDGAVLSDVPVGTGTTTTRNAVLRRDWAALKGGAAVLKDNTRYDNTGAAFGCGLDQLADQNLGTGSSAFNPRSTEPDNPKLGTPTAVIKLPRAINIAWFGLDPSNTCGDDPTSTTKDYRIETSVDGAHWTLAKAGSFTLADRGRLNVVTPTGGANGVRYVRLQALSPQRANDLDSGADFIDFSEIAVYGNAVPTGSLTASPGSVRERGAVTLTAAFIDPDHDAISSYRWDLDGDGADDRTTAAPRTTVAYRTTGTIQPVVTATDSRGGVGRATTGVTVRPIAARIGKLPRSGRHGKLTIRVTCLSRCRVTASLTMRRALKRTLHLGRARVVRISKSIKTSGVRRITLTVPRKVRRAADRHHVRTLKNLKLVVSAKTADGKGPTRSRTVRIRL